MHTLYENKNYVHKLFTNIYEKKLQSNNIKHRKSNKERKKKKKRAQTHALVTEVTA